MAQYKVSCYRYIIIEADNPDEAINISSMMPDDEWKETGCTVTKIRED